MDRARILLYKADGMTFQQIADKLAISTATVRLCVSKFHKGGLDAALFVNQQDFMHFCFKIRIPLFTVIFDFKGFHILFPEEFLDIRFRNG